MSKRYGRLTVHRHIDTFSNPEENLQLLRVAQDFITETTGQMSMLDVLSIFRPSNIAVSENRPLFVFRLLSKVYDKLGLGVYPHSLVKDLIIARIYLPKAEHCKE